MEGGSSGEGGKVRQRRQRTGTLRVVFGSGLAAARSPYVFVVPKTRDSQRRTWLTLTASRSRHSPSINQPDSPRDRFVATASWVNPSRSLRWSDRSFTPVYSNGTVAATEDTFPCVGRVRRYLLFAIDHHHSYGLSLCAGSPDS